MKDKITFSIIIVCLNPGEKLKITLDSVFMQTFQDYEVIIKDGGSTDGSVESWNDGGEPAKSTSHSNDPQAAKESQRASAVGRVRFYNERDKGIYDAMNQAVSHATGDFVVFLNCGDTFADQRVLERTEKAVMEQTSAGADPEHLVLYGDTLGEKNGVIIASPPAITGFTCYRNIPCHQSCFYSAALCREKPYDLNYRIRADYDHFLWCYYRGRAKFVHMRFPVASYEGGGYSESKTNRRRDKEEHRLITKEYMGKGELFCYRAFMICTLAPLRSALAESKAFSGVYHWLKKRVYGRSS